MIYHDIHELYAIGTIGKPKAFTIRANSVLDHVKHVNANINVKSITKYKQINKCYKLHTLQVYQ